jgi:glycosyltransferase involved in cell wall biosynthesis
MQSPEQMRGMQYAGTDIWSMTERIRHRYDHVVLHVNHSCGGGTEKHVQDLCSHFQDRAAMLVIRTMPGQRILVEKAEPHGNGSNTLCIVKPDSDYEFLLELLRCCGVSRVHVHQLFSLPLDIQRLIIDLNVPFDVTVHDYYALCPHVHFKTKASEYCGEPDESGCKTCLGSGPDHGAYQNHWIGSHDHRVSWPAAGAPDIRWWRQSHKWVFDDAERVICPSADVALRIKRYCPSADCIVVPHDSLDGPVQTMVQAGTVEAHQPLVVGVLGGMNPFKGSAKVSACALRVRETAAPIVFHVVGSASTEMPLAPTVSLFETGKYEQYQVQTLIKDVGPHVIWFPTQVPETFSYTLSEALEAGLPVVVPNIGAFAGRVRGRPWSWVVRWDMSPDHMVSFLCEIRKKNFLIGTPPELDLATPYKTRCVTTVRDFYETEYMRSSRT